MTLTSVAERDYATLRVSQEGRVVTALISDPPHNYMTARMQQDLDVLTDAVDADDTVGAVILAGATPGRFITHFDIAEILSSAENIVPGVDGAVGRSRLAGIRNEVDQRRAPGH